MYRLEFISKRNLKILLKVEFLLNFTTFLVARVKLVPESRSNIAFRKDFHTAPYINYVNILWLKVYSRQFWKTPGKYDSGACIIDAQGCVESLQIWLDSHFVCWSKLFETSTSVPLPLAILGHPPGNLNFCKLACIYSCPTGPKSPSNALP